MADLFHMGGFGVYIWPSFGITALVLIGLAVRSLQTFRRLSAEAEQLRAASPRGQEDAS